MTLIKLYQTYWIVAFLALERGRGEEPGIHCLHIISLFSQEFTVILSLHVYIINSRTYTSCPIPQVNSKKSNNGPSNIWTTTTQWVNYVPLIECTINLTHFQPPRYRQLINSWQSTASKWLYLVNLCDSDNLQTNDKISDPNISVIQRFHCRCILFNSSLVSCCVDLYAA